MYIPCSSTSGELGTITAFWDFGGVLVNENWNPVVDWVLVLVAFVLSVAALVFGGIVKLKPPYEKKEVLY